MSSCDICGGKTGLFHTFRCRDGKLCKKCYQIASGNYASTISGLTLTEVKKRYIRNAQPLDMGEDGFQTTKKIGAFLLLDEKNQKFCVLSNSKLTGGNGGASSPKIFLYHNLLSIQLVSNPPFPPDSLTSLASAKDSATVIRRLAVRLSLRDAQTHDIVVIPTPVRTSSFAFRRGLKYAMEICDCLNSVLV